MSLLSRFHAKPLAKQHLCHHSEGLCSTLKDDHQGLTASVPDHLDMDLSVQTDVQYLWESSAKKLGQGSTKKCKLDTHLAAKCLLGMDRTCSILEDTIHSDRAVTCMGEMAPAFTPTGRCCFNYDIGFPYLSKITYSHLQNVLAPNISNPPFGHVCIFF